MSHRNLDIELKTLEKKHYLWNMVIPADQFLYHLLVYFYCRLAPNNPMNDDVDIDTFLAKKMDLIWKLMKSLIIKNCEKSNKTQ